MKRLWLLVLLSLASAPVFAYFVDGNDLVEWRNSYVQINAGTSKDHYGGARFMGEVMAVADVLILAEIIQLPRTATAGQVCMTVARWLDLNPTRWTEPAVVLIRDALVEAYGVD